MVKPKPHRTEYDVIVVGAGPNGLSAAIELAREGLSVLVVEGRSEPGGGARSSALTRPGFVHDVCSAVHPLGRGSPFFRSLSLEQYGLEWIEPSAPLAHLLADGNVVTLERSVDATAAQLGQDGPLYKGIVEPFVERFDELMHMVLGPLRMPSAPMLLARFGLVGLRSAESFAGEFANEPARALFAGIAAHAMLRLDQVATASFGLVLAMAGHAVGWPIARGGTQAITNALVQCFVERGGELVLGVRVHHLDDLPRARAYVLDVTPRQVLSLAAERLPERYLRRLRRFRYGSGVFKMDWALSGPIPWTHPNCARAATVHLSGSFADLKAAEGDVHEGRIAQRPFVLLTQPSLFDGTRAPSGFHTAWAYCHVPHDSDVDVSAAIEAEVERFAPGFKETILARSSRTAVEMEQYNPNYVGGDINGGLSDLSQLFFRPVARLDPYSTPAPDLFLCSSSTPPGGGVHGMCGYWAARSVLARRFSYIAPPQSIPTSA